MEKIVQQLADEVLYYYGGNQYVLLMTDGKLIGKIRARSDEEAIQKTALLSRKSWEKKKGGHNVA
jgi:hypothetical protein